MTIRPALLVACCVVALAGCTSAVGGTQHLGASAAPDSPGGTGADGDGPAPAAPRAAAIIETHRLGASVVDARALLPDVQYTCIPDGPYPTAAAAAGIVFGTGTSALLTRAGYVGGWINCFHTGGKQRSGVLGLVEAHDAKRARALATNLALGSVHPGAKPVTLDGLPQATVVQYPNVDKNPVIIGMVTTGRIISYAYGDTEGGGAAALPAVRDMVGKMLAAQVAKAKAFTPTPTDALQRLDDDPELLEEKIVQPPGDPSWFNGGYSPATYVAVATNPAAETQLLAGNGFTEFYRKDGDSSHLQSLSLYALRDAAAAKRVLYGEERFAQADNANRARVTLPHSRDTYCYAVPVGTGGSLHQQCLLSAGRYLVEADTVSVAKRAGDVTVIQGLIRQQLALTPR